METEARIYVAGADTLVGAAILRALAYQGYTAVLNGATSEPDLHDARAVEAFFAEARPEYVFHAAGTSAGIHANQTRPAELILDNALVSCHVVDAAHRHTCRKLLYLASSCTYPRDCPQPMPETALFTGPPEPTNRFYSEAKLMGLRLCQACRVQYGDDFIVGIPANPFGIGDDFDPATSHVVPALIRKMHEAKAQGLDAVDVWGTGNARRDFVFADDLADACLFAMARYSDEEPVNLSGGEPVTIRELAETVREVAGFAGELRFDISKPDGMPVKALDGAKLRALGWQAKTPLPDAVRATYAWYVSQASGAAP